MNGSKVAKGTKVTKDTKDTKDTNPGSPSGNRQAGLRIPSPLSREVEQLVYDVIGAAMAVHTALGPGLPENAYRDALLLELTGRGFLCTKETVTATMYKGQRLKGHRLDLVVNDMVVVEVKAVTRLMPVHSAQLLSYLRASGKPVGILLNFNEEHLRDGIRRHLL